MVKKWQKKLYNSMNTDGPYPFESLYLTRPKSDDLSKQWCVTYWIWSFTKNALTRKRVIVTGNTVQARLADADQVIKELNEYLKDGMVYEGEKPVSHQEPALMKAAKIETTQICQSPY